MNRKYRKWIGVTALACTIGLAFLGAALDSETVVVKRLLEKRADVMGNVLLDKITLEEGKQLLKDIEADKLYRDDLESLQKYDDADINMATDMRVVDLQKTSQLYDMMTFEGEISWRYSGKNGSFGHKDVYQIGVSKEGERYKLISFTLQ